MTQLTWDGSGERFYETGVDRGVLFVGSNPGVAWNGLVAVTENPAKGEPQPYYFDGVKYLNISTAEEFEAKITAMNAPSEFLECEGIVSVQNGLYATQQPKLEFDLSYRTLIGNDVTKNLGYKIHLVYGALAQATDRLNKTLDNVPAPNVMNWDITTLPPSISGYRRTSHFVVDSISTPPALLSSLEDLLYGTSGTDPQIPTAQGLIDMFTA